MIISDGIYLAKRAEKSHVEKSVTLILTHHHSDHIFSMHVFKKMNAKIIAHENLLKIPLQRNYPTFTIS